MSDSTTSFYLFLEASCFNAIRVSFKIFWLDFISACNFFNYCPAWPNSIFYLSKFCFISSFFSSNDVSKSTINILALLSESCNKVVCRIYYSLVIFSNPFYNWEDCFILIFFKLMLDYLRPFMVFSFCFASLHKRSYNSISLRA